MKKLYKDISMNDYNGDHINLKNAGQIIDENMCSCVMQYHRKQHSVSKWAPQFHALQSKGMIQLFSLQCSVIEMWCLLHLYAFVIHFNA